ncbi:MAG: serine hydrolase [Oscillospiraceae bacterium]|nr:serine hydrolase [Oscillospiraceae bacterium]
MRKFLKRISALIMSLSVMCCTITANAAEAKLPSGVGYDEIGGKIEEFVSQHEDTTAAMSVSVFNSAETYYSGYFGYADKENGIVNDSETVMEWGSATKLLVWVSVMQLWEQGKIDLDTDISVYLPEGFLVNQRYETPVTMTHLMNHSAGYQETYADLFVKSGSSIPSLEEALKAHYPAQIYEPGTVPAYSNWGVALAGFIVERISGLSFSEYVHQNIFTPLNMNNSALSPDLSDNEQVASQRKKLQCYTADGVLMPDCFYHIPLYPAGMCTSTLADFEAFGKALLDENTPLFKNKDTRDVMFTPTAYYGNSGKASNYHGFWVIPFGIETVGHGGNTAGCSSFLLLDLESGTGAAVMTNQAGETVYNSEMMELIFGKFNAEAYFSGQRGEADGIYRPARTVREGAFKIMSASFIVGSPEAEDVWFEQENGNIRMPYGDYVKIPVGVFVLEAVLFILLLAVPVLSFLSLIVKLIVYIIRKIMKKDTALPLGRWNIISGSVQTVFIVLLGFVAVSAFGYALSSTYAWAIAVAGILAVIMLVLAVYGFVKLPKTESGKFRKFCNYTTAVCLAVTVVNIAYWNLFMFWKI